MREDIWTRAETYETENRETIEKSMKGIGF